MKIAVLIEEGCAVKEIIAIIRPERWAETRQKLAEIGIMASTQHRVYGRGRQTGLRYLKQGAKDMPGVSYIPKRMVHIIVDDGDVQRAVDTLIEVNQTPAFGDGKIYVCPVEDAVRIRTQEAGAAALA